MIEFDLPYGKTSQRLRLEERHYAGSMTSSLADYVPPVDGDALVTQALEHPVGAPRLCELARDKRRVVVISSDHTRPVPSRVILPKLLREIRRGNPKAEITILVATGLHRQTTRQELLDKYGEEICRNERIVIHDCDDRANLVDLGTLPSGGRLSVNRLAAEADLLIAEGFIEPHFFAGFSGGRKSVLPCVAGRARVMYNHHSAFIAHPRARTGVLEGNPIHTDMAWAARAAKLAFIVNVVLDAAHRPIYAVAGDCEQAHLAGCDFLASRCRAQAVPADIVVATNGGYPLDQNIYQAATWWVRRTMAWTGSWSSPTAVMPWRSTATTRTAMGRPTC